MSDQTAGHGLKGSQINIFSTEYRNKNYFLIENEDLKVKCNEIWTIFLLLKILFKNIIHTNRKQNQLSKFGFAQTVELKIRKSDGFRELHENEPEMAAPRLETNIRYL